MLTETELKQIHVESETLYPYPVDKSDIQNLRLQEMKRRVFFAAVTKERERAKMLAIEFNKWCNRELWKHEHAEQRTFTDDEKYFYFIKQYNQ